MPQHFTACFKIRLTRIPRTPSQFCDNCMCCMFFVLPSPVGSFTHGNGTGEKGSCHYTQLESKSFMCVHRTCSISWDAGERDSELASVRRVSARSHPRRSVGVLLRSSGSVRQCEFTCWSTVITLRGNRSWYLKNKIWFSPHNVWD